MTRVLAKRGELGFQRPGLLLGRLQTLRRIGQAPAKVGGLLVECRHRFNAAGETFLNFALLIAQRRHACLRLAVKPLRLGETGLGFVLAFVGARNSFGHRRKPDIDLGLGVSQSVQSRRHLSNLTLNFRAARQFLLSNGNALIAGCLEIPGGDEIGLRLLLSLERCRQ